MDVWERYGATIQVKMKEILKDMNSWIPANSEVKYLFKEMEYQP